MKGRIARAPSTIRKHSLLVAGHATSISLEEAFWTGLKAIAAARATPVAQIVAEIDSTRQAANLSSAIRVFVLDHYRHPVSAGLSSDPPR